MTATQITRAQRDLPSHFFRLCTGNKIKVFFLNNNNNLVKERDGMQGGMLHKYHN